MQFTKAEREMIYDALTILGYPDTQQRWSKDGLLLKDYMRKCNRSMIYDRLTIRLNEAGWSDAADVPDEYQNICSVSTKERN